MQKLGIKIRNQLLIMLAYMGLILGLTASSMGSESDLSYIIASAMVIFVHVVMLLILAVVVTARKEKDASQWVLTSLVVLIVGFSACLRGGSLMNML